jgi:hypothetical protein
LRPPPSWPPFALAPVSARADVGRFIPAEPIDGPVTALGDLDVARDGTGAVAYVKPDGGVDHVFVSRLDGGAWQAPERLDVGLPGPGSQPVVAAATAGGWTSRSYRAARSTRP